tara:strand:- start:104 stop:334 length:231 start_codon:yes stop_codon:yes gene_type:complete
LKVGDLVRVRRSTGIIEGLRGAHDVLSENVGIITDCLEDSTGFYHFEVAFPDECGWFSDLELEIVQDSCKITPHVV